MPLSDRAKESAASVAARLAKLDEVEAEVLLAEEAARLGIGVPALRKAVRAARAKPRGRKLGALPVTEDMLAAELAKRHAARLRYDHDARLWHVFDGAVWRADRRGQVFLLIRELCREYAGRGSEGLAKALGRYATVGGIERLARSEAVLAVTRDVWDADPFLLGTPDGTVELRTGELRPADPADMISRCTAVAPAPPGTPCPAWEEFVAFATAAHRPFEQGGDLGELYRLVQVMCGYALTGSTVEQCLFLLTGDGGNGKGTLLDTIWGIMADYAGVARMETFLESAFERHPAEIMALEGLRMARAAEVKEGQAWDDRRIKELTGQDPVSARGMNENFRAFVPRFKLMVSANNKPLLRVVDAAIVRRLVILPFNETPPAPDKTLRDRLRAEWPAILRWMIDGCLEWQDRGIPTSARAEAEKSDYLGQQDTLQAWIADACEVDERPLPPVDMAWKYCRRERNDALYAAWVKAAEAAGERAGSQKRFSGRLAKLGFMAHRTGMARYWVGLALRATATQQPDVFRGFSDG